MSRQTDLERFYTLLARLRSKTGSPRRLVECHGRQGWPLRGVYFLAEPGEHRASGAGLRVVRVGSHALSIRSRTTLWHRLAQHRGTLNPPGGNHRGSIFRLQVGEALLKAGRSPVEVSDTWGKGSSAPRAVREHERPLEIIVGEQIGAMWLLCLPIEDPPSASSQRGFIERNSLALLSNCGKTERLDPPSADWLGHYSPRPVVRASGLWNVNHVDQGHDPSFLSVLEQLISKLPCTLVGDHPGDTCAFPVETDTAIDALHR